MSMRFVAIIAAGFAIVLTGVFSLPVSAHAQVQSPCPTVVHGFVPHINDGRLDSFDFFVSSTGTPVVGNVSVGSIPMESRYVTTWQQGAWTKVHVDVPSWYGFSGVTPVVVSVSKGVCSDTETFAVLLPQNLIPKKAAVPVKAPVAVPQEKGTVEKALKPVASSPIHASVSCEPGKATLSWDTDTTNVTQFVVERSDAPKGAFAAIKILPGNELGFTDTSVREGAAYSYRVKSFLAGKTLSTSPEVACGIPVAAAATPPPVREAPRGCSSWPALLWVGLVIAQLVSSIVIVDKLARLLQGNGWRFSLALFVPFATLLAAWFVFDACRAFQWFPVIVTLVTLATLFAPVFGTRRVL